jgi:quercetin dioxygenase-like cupin family protein
MDEREWSQKLREEGFSRTYKWEDAPGAFYPEHSHPTATVHVILSGEMTLTIEGNAQSFRTGQRFDVPAHAVHSAVMGPKGCRYLIGES